MDLVIASTNLHKIREFRDMLKRFKHIDPLSLLNFSDYKQPEEDGKTFKENALLKGLHANKILKKWVLSDDSGLVVPSLEGAPGVISRRWAGEDATDAECRSKLLKEMQHLEEHQRSAYYECCLVLVNPEGIAKCVTGTCEGIILKEERGRNGFGYDSLFLKHDYDKTFAEIDESTKNKISHRRKAFEKLVSTFETMIS